MKMYIIINQWHSQRTVTAAWPSSQWAWPETQIDDKYKKLCSCVESKKTHVYKIMKNMKSD